MKLKLMSTLAMALLGFVDIAEASSGIKGFSCENNMYRQSRAYLDGQHLFFKDSWSWLPMDELKLQLQRKYGLGEVVFITDPGISLNTEQLRCDRSTLENFHCVLENSHALAKLTLTVATKENKFGQSHFTYLQLDIPVKLQKLELSMKRIGENFAPQSSFLAEAQLQMEEEWSPVALKWETFFYLKNKDENRFSSCRSW